MTHINPKEIRTNDVNGIYDVLLAEVTQNPDTVPDGTTAETHVRQMVSQKLTKLAYPMAANVDRILQTHAGKLQRSGGSPATVDTATQMTLDLYEYITSKKITRNGSAPAPVSKSTPASGAAAPQAAASSTPKPQVSMHMNTSFTIASEKEQMLDTMLSNITSAEIGSFATLLAAMEMAEEAKEAFDTANKSVADVIAKYQASEENVNEDEMLPLPDFEVTGYATLDTSNALVSVLNDLISQNVTPSITYEEAVERIKNAEAAISEARLVDKAQQRDLRRARPKSAQPVIAPVKTQLANNTNVAEELNAHVQVVEQIGSDVFTNSYGATSAVLGFDIPTLEFDDVHPNVPKIDPSFRFFTPVLCEALHSISENEIIWLHGDSGCGKSAFWEQVAARLNFPFTRMNLDGHLTRSDIVGVNRMMPNEDNQMEMRFVKGILPRAMQNPGLLLLDEFDLGDCELMPILQPVLEGEPLVLLENGGEVIHPHPMFRIAITGNTIGLGSPNQMYNNAFEQSAATRDRISAFVEMPYMPADIEKEVTMARIPNADENFVEKLIQLANKVREGFKAGEIHQIFSTRAVLYCSSRYARFAPHYASPEDAADEILNTVILGRMDDMSHNVVKGLIDNIFE